MSMQLLVTPSRKIKAEFSDSKLSLRGFSEYVLQFEGTQLTSRDKRSKELVLEVGLDGALLMNLQALEQNEPDNQISSLLKLMPPGYELFHQTQAAKVIKGIRGSYYHFHNKLTGDFISFNVGGGPRPYRIVLGRLDDPQSKIRQVLERVPDRPFKKAQLVHLLPQSIVENRQPIKAVIDILEKEGYVQKVTTHGISDEYIRTEKPIPAMTHSENLVTA